MTEFYNPYNFIPVTGKINGRPTHKMNYDETIRTDQNKRCRHDVWSKDTLSGRIVCRLSLETPTIIGAQQTGPENGPKTVLPYERNGQPAIPGNSIRGMIGSVVETLSQSALRVLEDKPLKVSIWNGRGIQKLSVGMVHQYFENIGKDTLPWGSGRSELTPAELLLGVVEDGEDKDEGQTRNLASRLRFSDALPLPGAALSYHDSMTLKILDSPKPPCPAMYFHLRTDTPEQRSFIGKRDLNPANHAPNGRKIYLHHQMQDINRACWKSDTKASNHEHDHQKLIVRPICKTDAEGKPASFYFHIDFDNLNPAELTLLIFSLRPPKFRHRLGLGKPIGLGRVFVKIEGLFLIDRANRYGREALNQPRYCFAWRGEKADGYDDLAKAYPTEAVCLQSEFAMFGKPEDYEFFDKSLVDNQTLKLLCAIGNPDNLQPNVPVHTPLTENQPSAEDETFRWFVSNDQRCHATLPPLLPIAPPQTNQPRQYLPTMQRNQGR